MTPLVSSKTCNPVPLPSVENAKYAARFAATHEEIEAALKLRFEVFNLELGEGLASSFQTGRDRDEFDSTCHHLIVVEKSSNEVVGTYRVRTLEMARSAGGFYSAGEFDLAHLPFAVLSDALELGRACIAREHRRHHVLFLLWKALARYAALHQKRFLFGCCSLNSQEPLEGLHLFKQLSDGGHLHPTLRVPPKRGFECLTEAGPWPGEAQVPMLFKTYLSIGAKVCGPPAIDRRFKTIDFFVLFDIGQMSARNRKLFEVVS